MAKQRLASWAKGWTRRLRACVVVVHEAPPAAQLVHGGRHALVLLGEPCRQRFCLAQPPGQRCRVAQPAEGSFIEN